MSKFFDALVGSKTGLEFVSRLATDPNLLQNSYDQLKGVPIKNYPSQKYADGTDTKTLSKAIIGAHHPEFDRTGFGHVHLHGLITNDLNTYPGVNIENFRKAQQCIFDAIKQDGYDEECSACSKSERLPTEFIDHDKLDALTVLLGIHDLAKIVDFHDKAIDTAKRYKIPLDVKEHDEVAWKILTSGNEDCIRELYPDFHALNQKQRNRVLGALKGRVNPGRLYQLEGTPGELDQGALDTDIAFDLAMYKAYHFLDLGSIRGNYYVVEGEPLPNPQNGKRGDVFWNSFIIENFIKVLELSGQVLCGTLSPVTAYERILETRAKTAGIKDLTDPIQRATARLFSMMNGRVPGLDVQKIVEYLQDNEEPSKLWKNNLITELNESGYDGRPAICVGYGPDLATSIGNGMKSNTNVNFVNMLDVFAQSYNNCLTVVREAIKYVKKAGQITVELEQITKLLSECNNYLAFYHRSPEITPLSDGFVVTTIPASITTLSDKIGPLFSSTSRSSSPAKIRPFAEETSTRDEEGGKEIPVEHRLECK